MSISTLARSTLAAIGSALLNSFHLECDANENAANIEMWVLYCNIICFIVSTDQCLVCVIIYWLYAAKYLL